MSFGRSEIIQWKKDGWTFRKKTVKGYQYITRRKGKQEKSLGRYSEKLWEMVEGTSFEISRFERRCEVENTIKLIINVIRSSQMSGSCSNIVDGFCHFWKFREKPGFFIIAESGLGEGYFREVCNEQNHSFWVFKAEPFYCGDCSAYKKD